MMAICIIPLEVISSNTIIIHPPKIQLIKPICCNTNNYIYRFKNYSTFYLLVVSSPIFFESNSLRVKVAENKACQKHLEIRQLFSCNSFFAFFMQCKPFLEAPRAFSKCLV